jgi:formate hydrogenlyase subunit 3/multisubunit Na+/H+ antiporter MnhD subunit
MFILIGRAFSEFTLTFPFYFITTILFVLFLSDNILAFFFLFERTVLPIIYVILNEGKRQERLKAAFYMFAYIVFGSFPLLFFLFIV